MPDCQHQIVQRVLHLPLPVQFQPLAPVIFRRKLLPGRLRPVLCQRQLHLFVTDRKLAHSLKGRQLRSLRILRSPHVQLPKLMDTHHVKSIHQLPAGRVRGMVGIRKLPLINHHPRLGIRRYIIIPPLHGARLIHVRQEHLRRFLDAVRPAERPDHALLGERVRLLLHLPQDHRLLPPAHRPLRRIPPVPIPCKHHIRVQDLPRNIPEHKLPVRRRGRPVHQAGRLISGIVKHLHADVLRHLPRHRRILVRRHIPGQRDHQPEPGTLRRMLMRGIDQAPEVKEHLHPLRDIRLGMVHVQRQGGPEHHAVLLPPAAFQLPHHKAAHVLDGILPRLGQLPVLLHRLRRPYRPGNSLNKIFQLHLPAVPPLLHPRIARRNINLHTHIPPVLLPISFPYPMKMSSYCF